MLIEKTVIVQVLRGAWLPPGSTKLVGVGGQKEVGEATALDLVRQWPDRYKILKANHGKIISPSKKQPPNIQRESEDLDIGGQRSDSVDAAE